MGDGNENLELSPRKGLAISKKLRVAGSKVFRPTQSSVTCESPSINARLVRLPLTDLSNTLDSPMCTQIPLKPSWTCINRSFFESDEKLKIAVGKKRVLPPKKKSAKCYKKTKLVSQTEKENVVILVEAGAQPRQEL